MCSRQGYSGIGLLVRLVRLSTHLMESGGKVSCKHSAKRVLKLMG